MARMKSWQITLTILIILLIVSTGIFLGIKYGADFSNDQPVNTITYEILIEKNEDFVNKYHFQGAGTLYNPYLIENLIIHTQKDIAIGIKQTSKYFIIQNCTLSSPRTVIYINRVSPGNAIITGNNISSSGSCISIGFSDDAEITFNNINSESLNSINNGIYFMASWNTLIKGNNIFGFYTGINCGNSIQNVIQNNNCSNCKTGIKIGYHYAYNSTNSAYIRNNMITNSEYGLAIYHSLNLLLYSNIIQNSSFGIYLINSDLCKFYQNNISHSSSYAVYSSITSESPRPVSYYNYGNIFYMNNFNFNNYEQTQLDNSQAYDDDDENSNHWFNNITNLGNFWSDLKWDDGVIYEIDGGNKTDPYPLEHPVEI